MKKLIFIISIFISSNTYAQPSAVTNAALYHMDNELAKALVEINSAIDHPKTKEDAKTWFIRGSIYQTLITTELEQYKTLCNDAHDQAFASYIKAIELDPKKGEYYKQSVKNMDNLYPAFINRGYGEYKVNDFDAALKSFETAQLIRPADTTAYIYGTFAADEAKRYDLIKKYIDKLKELNYKSPQMYAYEIVVAKNIDNNPAKALEVTKRALKDYPGNSALLQEQINLFIGMGKAEEAIKSLEQLSASAPDNVEYLSTLASLYDQVEKPEKAYECYSKVLKKDPEHYVSNYNVAVMCYELGRQAIESGKEAEAKANLDKALASAQKVIKMVSNQDDKENIQMLIDEINRIKPKK